MESGILLSAPVDVNSLGITGGRLTALHLDHNESLYYSTLIENSANLTFYQEDNTHSSVMSFHELGNTISIVLRNGKLYAMGVNTRGMFLATTPFNMTLLQNSTTQSLPIKDSEFSVDNNLQLSNSSQSCIFQTVNRIEMEVFGAETFILCTTGGVGVISNSTIYYHDGSNWTAPITITDVPWKGDYGLSQFIKYQPGNQSDPGQVWIAIADGGGTNFVAEVSVNNSTATWSKIAWDEERKATFYQYEKQDPYYLFEILLPIAVGVCIATIITILVKRRRAKTKIESFDEPMELK